MLKLGPGNSYCFRAGLTSVVLKRLRDCANVLFLPFFDACETNSILEPITCGVPVVVTVVGWFRVYIDRYLGFMVEPRSPELIPLQYLASFQAGLRSLWVADLKQSMNLAGLTSLYK